MLVVSRVSPQIQSCRFVLGWGSAFLRLEENIEIPYIETPHKSCRILCVRRCGITAAVVAGETCRYLHSLVAMWARGAVVVALLTFSGEIPTSTSFFFSPPSWTAPPTCHGYRSSTSSYPCRAVPFPRLGFAGERQHAQRRSRRPYSSSNASAEDAVQQYTNADLDSLTRSELQALCKELGVRAVGKTSELLTRLQHHRQHVQSLAEAEAFPSSSSSSSPSSPSPIGDHAPAPASVGENSRVGPNTTAVLDEILSTPDIRRSYATRNSKTRTPNTEPTTTPTTVVVSASTTPPPSTLRITPALGLSTPALGLSPPADGSGESVGAPPSEFLLDEMRPAFQELSDEQWDQAEMLGQLLTEWNGRVNLISRKDIANVLSRHVMPCLAMAKALNLRDGVEGERWIRCFDSLIIPFYPDVRGCAAVLPSLECHTYTTGTSN